MATFYTLSDTVTDPRGAGYDASVTVRLTDLDHNQIVGFYDAGVISTYSLFNVGADGAFSINLIANADITPANTYYSVKIGYEDPILIQMTANGDLDGLRASSPDPLQIPYRFGDLYDVSVPSPSDGQAAVWVDANSQWEAGDVAPDSPLTITANAADETPLSLIGYASQTAPLQTWKDSAGVSLVEVNEVGATVWNSPAGAQRLLVRGTTTATIMQAASGLLIQDNNSDTVIAVEDGNTLGFYDGTTPVAQQDSVSPVTALENLGLLTNGVETASSPLVLTSGGIAELPLTVQGYAGQTANLQEWQDSAGATLAAIDPDGDIVWPGGWRVAAPSTNFEISGGSGIATVAGSGASLSIGQSGNAKLFSATNKTVTLGTSPVINIQQGASPKYAEVTVAEATSIPWVVKGAAAQTANLQEWQDSTGEDMVAISASGNLIWSDPATQAAKAEIRRNGNDLQIASLNNNGIEIASSGASLKVGEAAGSISIWADGNDSAYLGVGSTGNPHIRATSTTLQAITGTASEVPFGVKGAAAQTANLQEWQDSIGTVFAYVDATGSFDINTDPGGVTDQPVLSAINNNSSDGVITGPVGFFASALESNWGYGAILRGKYIGVSGSAKRDSSNFASITGGAYSASVENSTWTGSATGQNGTSNVEVLDGGTYTGNRMTGGIYQSYLAVYGTAGGTVTVSEMNQLKTIPYIYGGNVADTINITDMKDLNISSGTYAPNGATVNIGTHYGIHIEEVANGTANYQIYSEGTAPSYFAGPVEFNAGVATDIPLTVKGAAAQTANLQEWRDSAGNVLASIDANGKILATSKLVLSGGGIASQPALSFSTDGNTGIYRKGGDDFALTVNSDIIRVKNSGGLQIGFFGVTPAYRPDGVSPVTALESLGLLTNGISTSESPLTLVSGDVAEIPLTLKGAVGQTADYFNILQSDDTEVFTIDSDGSVVAGSDSNAVRLLSGVTNTAIYLHETTDTGIVRGVSSAQISITASGKTMISSVGSTGGGNTVVGADATSVPLTVKGAAAQTASFMEIQDSTGLAVTKFIASGVGQIRWGSTSGYIAMDGESSGLEWKSNQIRYRGNFGAPSTKFELTTTGVGFFGKAAIAQPVANTPIHQMLSDLGLSATPGAADVPLVVKGAAAQTADLLQTQDSVGTIGLRVSPEGYLYGSSSGSNTLRFGVSYGGSFDQVVEIRNSTGGTHSMSVKDGHRFSATGTASITGAFTAFGGAEIRDDGGAAEIPLTVKGAVSQTANLQEWTDDTPTVLSFVDAAGVITAPSFAEDINTNAAAGATETLTLGTNNITMDADCTFTFPTVSSGDATSFTLVLRQDGTTGGWTPTWPAAVDWTGGTAPTVTSAAGSVDIFTFLTVDDGTTWLGFEAGLDMK